jgi:hypothetical protein
MDDMVHPAERMPDGTGRSGLSVGVVSEIVRERADAVVEVERLTTQLAGVVEERDRWKALAEAALDAVPQDHPDLGMWLVTYADLGGQS